MKQLKSLLFFVLPVIIVSLLIHWPTFNLALTGDDYLGYWRYKYYLEGHTQHTWNNFSFFFTDYGPQDTITATIHHFVGFSHRYYYVASYILRLLAAFSFYPLVLFLTKNKKAAYLSIIFFVVCNAGLETTDWSFNMPSYIAIAFLNIFLLVYVQSKYSPTIKKILLSGVLLYLTIISQPIRMTFLPGFLLLIEIYSILRDRKRATIKLAVARMCLFIFVGVFVYITGYLGNSIGAGETFSERVIEGGWKKVIAGNFSALRPYLEAGQFHLLAYPIAQFGAVIFPTNLIPSNYQPLDTSKAILKLLPPLISMYMLFIYLMKKVDKKNANKKTIVMIILGVIWTLFSLLVYVVLPQYPLGKSQFIAMVVGGYMLLFILYAYLVKFNDKRLTDGLVIGTFLTILSFIAPWFRTPAHLFESTGRYLIVPAAGLTILVGIFLSLTKKKELQKYIYAGFFLFLAVQAYASHSYLYHLSTVREIQMTDTIRKSIPRINNFGGREPLMFYFEPKDSEILHHTLRFGFPVIMGYQYDFFNVWNLAYTDNWDEVVLAHEDGSSLKRFSIPIEKVKLQNIYSFKLEGKTLLNTTEETRKKLQILQWENTTTQE